MPSTGARASSVELHGSTVIHTHIRVSVWLTRVCFVLQPSGRDPSRSCKYSGPHHNGACLTVDDSFWGKKIKKILGRFHVWRRCCVIHRLCCVVHIVLSQLVTLFKKQKRCWCTPSPCMLSLYAFHGINTTLSVLCGMHVTCANIQYFLCQCTWHTRTNCTPVTDNFLRYSSFRKAMPPPLISWLLRRPCSHVAL